MSFRPAKPQDEKRSLLFSRTEISASDGSVRDNDGIAQLVPTVAPFLQSLGLTATGSLVTGNIHNTAPLCSHSGDSLEGSWSGAAKLAANYGWKFISHTATYPRDLASMTPAQQQADTCGSAAAIDAHGLPGGHGMIAYPGAHPPPQAVQATYGAQCFAWGRMYGNNGQTVPSGFGTAPPTDKSPVERPDLTKPNNSGPGATGSARHPRAGPGAGPTRPMAGRVSAAGYLRAPGAGDHSQCLRPGLGRACGLLCELGGCVLVNGKGRVACYWGGAP